MRHSKPLLSAEFSPDGKRIVTVAENYAAWVWDATTARPLAGPLAHTNIIHAAQFSPDGNRIVTASEDNTARIWDAQTGQSLTGPLRHTDWVWSAQFSPDGQQIATASDDGTARIWDATTGQPLTDPLTHGGPVRSVQYSPEGKQIVTSSWDATARIWDAQTGKALVEPLRHPGWPETARFSPDGKRIVTACSDHAARVWDAQTGHLLFEPMVHLSGVLFAEFSPDGRRIVTLSRDNTVHVWDAQTGQLILPLEHAIWVLPQFSPDGKRVMMVSNDGFARIWDIAPTETRFPDWLLRLAETVSHKVLNKRSLQEDTKLDQFEEVHRIRQMLNHEAASNDWAVWGRWFLADRATRTISPFSSQTIPEYIEDRIREERVESLDEATLLAVGNAELEQRIAEARRSVELRDHGSVLAQQGKFGEAAAAFAALIELRPNDHGNWYRLTPLLVESGDTEGYREHCRAMLARFGATDDIGIAYRTAKLCLLLPTAGPELAAASRLAELAVTQCTNSSLLASAQAAKALAEYRQGRFGSAAEWAKKSLTVPGTYKNVEAYSILALACHQSGQTNEAHVAVAKAQGIVETKHAKLDSGGLGTQWQNVLVCHILLREAVALIEGKDLALKKTQ